MTDRVLQSFFADYYAQFIPGNAERLLDYYHDTCTAVLPDGVVQLKNREEIRFVLSRELEQLDEQGLSHTHIDGITAQLLNTSLAYVSINATRMATDGRELGRVGATYTLVNNGSHWRIAVLAVHGADEQLALTG